MNKVFKMLTYVRAIHQCISYKDVILQCSQYTQKRHLNIWNPFKRKNFGTYIPIQKPGELSASLQVPENIPYPVYKLTGQPIPYRGIHPEIKDKEQINGMQKSCKIARKIMNSVKEILSGGISTDEIDKLVHRLAVENNSYPSPLNYRGFPKSVCTSVNNVACHGIPDDRNLENGDIISVDITVYYGGFHGDCCETFLIGEVDKEGRHLVEVARKARDEAIKLCGPGIPFHDIGKKIQEIAVEENLNVVPVFIGHGIGSYFHGPPDIYHFYNELPGIMKPGMTFTVEPILTQGSEEVVILEDGWTAVTMDNGRAAQFEHTVLITNAGVEILTDYYT